MVGFLLALSMWRDGRLRQKSMQRPFFSQSPYRVGSGPDVRPPISRGTTRVPAGRGVSEGTGATGSGSGGLESGMRALRRERLNPAAPRDNRTVAAGADARVARMSDTRHPALVPLDRAELIEISGADALGFAHSQFASDVAGLAVVCWQWSAWLTAQGRTRCVFALLRPAADHLLIWLPLGGASKIRDELARFVLRAKVQLAVREGWVLASLDANPASDYQSGRISEHLQGYAFTQPGPEVRVAWLGPAPAQALDTDALNAWRLADIAAGLPWLDPATQGEFVPQALDLERLDALRFDKGCYPGQEIAARLHFRGSAKARLHRLLLLGDGEAPPGMPIESSTGNAGVVLYGARVSAHTREALAVLADAFADSAALKSAAGHVVEPRVDA